MQHTFTLGAVGRPISQGKFTSVNQKCASDTPPPGSQSWIYFKLGPNTNNLSAIRAYLVLKRGACQAKNQVKMSFSSDNV